MYFFSMLFRVLDGLCTRRRCVLLYLFFSYRVRPCTLLHSKCARDDDFNELPNAIIARFIGQLLLITGVGKGTNVIKRFPLVFFFLFFVISRVRKMTRGIIGERGRGLRARCVFRSIGG